MSTRQSTNIPQRSMVIVLIVVLSTLVGVYGAESESLVVSKYFFARIPGKTPKSYWWPRNAGMTFRNGTLTLVTEDKRQTCGFRVDISKEIGESIHLDLMARVESGNAWCTMSLVSGKGKWLHDKTMKITSSAWEKITINAPLADNANTVRISFTLNGKPGKLMVKEVALTIIPKINNVSGKIKIRNGDAAVDCSGIYIAAGNPGREFYDKAAAKLVRKHLYVLSGQILPIRNLDDVGQALGPGMILIGKAAERDSRIAKATLDAVKPGGFAFTVDKGIVALTGKRPGGVISGVYVLLEKLLGVTFVDQYTTEPPMPTSEDTDLLFKEMTVTQSPAFAFRFTRKGDALGYTNCSCLGDARMIGCRSSSTPHTASGFIDFDKYHETHPEYFALGKDGLRLHRDPKSKRFDVHLCMSNPDVQKLVADQVIAWMQANPEAKYFWLSPGDGGGKFCRCPKCLAMDEKPGVYTDRNLKFVNAVAKLVAEKFPDNVLLTLAYVDIEEPPIKTRPLPNVGIMYCPYPRNWSNHLEAFDPEYNAKGKQTLDGWLSLCPQNMYVFCYPSCCGETMNIWPAFYANYEKFKYYAQHGVKGIYYCGLRAAEGGYPGHNSFNAMSRFVLGKVLWNPELDVEKEIDHFMNLYYGPAAPHLRAFFNLIHREVRERHFVQHTEEVKRGFVTESLAKKAYPMFAAAEKAVADTPKYLDRVLREKGFLLFADLSDRCRTNGKIRDKDLPRYAEKLAEFAKICKKFHISYFARKNTPQGWFWNTALIRIKNSRWYNDPVIDALIKKPLETIGDQVPRCQEKIPGGFMVPSIGIAGGINLATYSYKCPRKDNVKLLRRPSSGYGYMMTNIFLDAAPAKAVNLELEGLDNDKPGAALMRIRVNNTVIYEGKAPFAKDVWGWKPFTIPAGVLKKGKNLIEMENTTPDIVTREEKKVVDFIVGRKKNYHWGWYIVSGLRITGLK